MRTFLVMLLALAPLAAGREKIAPETYRRTAFLGDSITDGNTYPALVRDALKDAGLPPMVAINAGIGGDTAAGMHKRIERDVLAFHPTLVTLSCGANDCFRPVPADEFEKDVRAIADRLKSEHVPLILLTPNVLGPKQARGREPLKGYEAILRKIAGEYDLPLAEVNRRETEDAAAGHEQLCDDDLHPNYEGQRMIARAVLDAMGYPDVPVPPRVHNTPAPGLVPDWRFRPADARELPLTPDRVAAVKPDASWVEVKLPETRPTADADSTSARWLDDYRQAGVSLSLRDRLPKDHTFVGVATLDSPADKDVQFHTGADLSAVRLNGKEIYRAKDFRGWHPGRESVTAHLNAGENTLVIETGPVFFLSVTDGPMW